MNMNTNRHKRIHASAGRRGFFQRCCELFQSVYNAFLLGRPQRVFRVWGLGSWLLVLSYKTKKATPLKNSHTFEKKPGPLQVQGQYKHKMQTEHEFIYTCANIMTNTHIHTYIYIYMYIYMYAHGQVRVCGVLIAKDLAFLI